MPETVLLWSAIAGYTLAAAMTGAAYAPLPAQAVSGPARNTRSRAALVFGIALTLHTLSLALRWQALGHGPFTTMHEILSSNLWSLALVVLLAGLVLHEARGALALALPVLLTLAVWMMMADAHAGHMPPTYATPLLYVHAVVGKLFLGLLLVAVALGGVPLLRRTPWGASVCADWPAERRLDELAHRFAAFAFVFETLMLIVGAAWAQDAWGRYWAWDPLETWAFLTWLALAAALHARATTRPAPAWFGAWLIGVFVLAFLTFFGVPFLSTVPHKGAV